MGKKGFTLAEVLITLAIIGVVAAMTVPSLLQGQQEKATVTAVKKAYSTLSNAYTLAVQENGTPDNWGLGGASDAQGAMNIINNLAPYLKISKFCGINIGDGCSANHKDLLGGSYNQDYNGNVAKIILSDGSEINTFTRSATCGISVGSGNLALQNTCADIEVDVNGHKKPNILGQDTFRFHITKYGIIPKGSQQETGYSFSSFCLGTAPNAIGEGCTAWVIYNENLDYLHCNGLDWNGPTKCP